MYKKPSPVFFLVFALLLLPLVRLLAQADNPIMDMRMSVTDQTCVGDSSRINLLFAVRTTDGTARQIAQLQNSAYVPPDFASRVGRIVTSQWYLPVSSYEQFWGWTQSEGVLEFQAIIRAMMPATSLGGPDSSTWHPVISFDVTFAQDPVNTSQIEWWWDTPQYNVRAATIPPGGTETIQRDELGAPLDVPLFCGSADRADLELSKMVIPSAPATVTEGDSVTYTISVTNAGPAMATSVLVSDNLPPGIAFLSGVTTAGVYDALTGIWSVGDLQADSTAVLSIYTLAGSAGTWMNYAAVSSAVIDPDTVNNSDSVSVDIFELQTADLVLSKNTEPSGPLTVEVGDTVIYTVVFRNNGPDEATNVVVADTLPAGIQYLSSETTSGQYDSDAGMWTVGSVLSGGSDSLRIYTTAVQTGAWLNTASITADQDDPVAGNERDSIQVVIVSTPLGEVDIVVKNRVTHTQVEVSDTLTFILTIRNVGSIAATNVVVVDQLPVGLEYVTSPGGTWDNPGRTVTYAIANLAAQDSAVFEIRTSAQSPGIWSNYAAKTAVDQQETVTANDFDYETILISAPDSTALPDIQLSKTVDIPDPNPADTVTFTLVARNIGGAAAGDVQIMDVLHSGLSYVSSSISPPQGSFDPESGIWDIVALNPGTEATLTIRATALRSGQLTNYCRVVQVSPGDDNFLNDEDWVFVNVTTVSSSDLGITKSLVYPTMPVLGDSMTYRITLSNAGPDTARDIVVYEKLPVGLEFVMSSANAGSYDADTGMWQVGTLANGSSAILDLTGQVVRLDSIRNVAVIYNSSAQDPNTSNNADSVITLTRAGLGKIDARLRFISNTYNEPVAGQSQLVFAIDARSDDSLSYSIGRFSGQIQLDPVFTGQIAHPDDIQYPYRYFVGNYLSEETWNPGEGTIYYNYQWDGTVVSTAAISPGSLRKAALAMSIVGEWREILRISIVYTMAPARGSVTWTADSTFVVLASDGSILTGREEQVVDVNMTDIPLPVELISFEASATGTTVELTWQTGSETENLGFYIYRAVEKNGEFSKITETIIEGLGTSEIGCKYSFKDKTVESGKTYYYKLADVDFRGCVTFHKSVREVNVGVPLTYALEQNYPNPFNPETTIGFKLKEEGFCEVKIFNLKGQLVRTLVANHKPAGVYSIKWDGKGESGNVMPSGVYLYQLNINGFVQVRKMEFLR